MIIHTRLGAAQVVARQIPVALRPDDPKLLTATAPASPAQLQHSVTASLNTLFLALAGIAVIVLSRLQASFGALLRRAEVLLQLPGAGILSVSLGRAGRRHLSQLP
jgi:hypothetical protein